MGGSKANTNARIFELLNGIMQPDSFPSKNHMDARLRTIAYDELMGSNPTTLSDIFGKEHADYFVEIKKLSLAGFPTAYSNTSIIKKDEMFSGKQVIGKVRVTNSEIQYWLDKSVQEKGVILCDLQTASNNHTEILNQSLDQQLTENNLPLLKLIDSQGKHGAFLFVPENVKLDGVIKYEINCVSSPDLVTLIKIVSLLGESSSGNVVFEIESNENNEFMSLLAIQNEIILRDNSSLNFLENQNYSKKSGLFIIERIRQAKNSILNAFFMDQGGAVLERYLGIDLEGEGSEGKITALYRPENSQRYLFDTLQNHRSSHSTSDLLFKGVLGKEAYSKWKGNILVEKNTFGANGYQANNIILMDASAKAESVPGLEILTDDVRCSHGVTMGNIDKDQMFYLQSRGINKKDAENLIVDGFFLSTVKRIDDEDFRKNFQNTFKI
jgi:Fe-S cluster assembly protein SufD